MTSGQAYKAVGDNPCVSCPELKPRLPCAKRPECNEWKKYCFRRKVIEAARKKEAHDYYAINRTMRTFRNRKLKQEATGRRVRTI